MMSDLSPKAQVIVDAFDDEYYQKARTRQDALAAAFRVLVSNNEEWIDGTYMVKSEDILNIATELENL